MYHAQIRENRLGVRSEKYHIQRTRRAGKRKKQNIYMLNTFRQDALSDTSCPSPSKRSLSLSANVFAP